MQIEVKSKVFKIIEEAEIKCLQPKVNPPPQPTSYDFSHSGFQDGNSSHFTNYRQGLQTPYPQGPGTPPQGSQTTCSQRYHTPYPQGPQSPTHLNSQNYCNDTTNLNFSI